MLFVIFQGLAMACFAFTSSNLSTLAMEHMGPIAGTASSVQGVVGTIGGAAIGLGIGQAFDGTVMPFLWGMAGCAAGALVLANRAQAPVRRAGRATGAGALSDSSLSLRLAPERGERLL